MINAQTDYRQPVYTRYIGVQHGEQLFDKVQVQYFGTLFKKCMASSPNPPYAMMPGNK